MRKIFTILFALVAMVSFAQPKVNVRLDMGGTFGNMTEAQLKSLRGDAWSEEWESTVKPAILQDMIYEMNKTIKGIYLFGKFDDASLDLLVTLIHMDEDDDDTEFVVTCSFMKSDGSKTLLFTEPKEEDGKDTKKFTRITSKSFVEAASGVAFSFKRNITKASKKHPELLDL